MQERPETGVACATVGGLVNWRRCLPRAVGAGVVVGFLTGLLGVGGGFLIVPALVIGLGLDMTAAIGTSLVIVAVNAAAGFAAYAGSVDLDAGLALTVTGVAALSAVVAARLGARLSTDRLRRWFAGLVLGVASLVIAEVVVGLLAG